MNAPLPEFALPGFAPVAQPWQAGIDDELQCVQVRQETHDVKTFVLRSPQPRSFRYLPGQFITLELEIDGQRLNRCYTLSSTPTRPDLVSITVKRVRGGPVSNWLHDTLQSGDRLSVNGPSGVFSCFTQPHGAYLFLSGGSGITPLMSMARALHDLASGADVVFVHAARTPADVIFAEELQLLAKNMPRFRLALVCEQRGGASGYAGYSGRLDAGLLAHMAPDLLQRHVYCCGPAPFMAGVREMLKQMDCDMRHYREESFAFDSPASAPATTPAPVAGGSAPAACTPMPAASGLHTITLRKLEQRFDCGGDERLLAAAQRAGVRMPFSCSNGVCGTCKTLKLAGEVTMKHQGGIRQREIDQGWILPCCSTPQSDVVLDR